MITLKKPSSLSLRINKKKVITLTLFRTMNSHRPLRVGKHQLYGIIWLPTEDMPNDYMKSLFGGLLVTKVGNADKRSCQWCPRYLSDIRDDEIWYAQENAWYCAACYTKEEAKLEERAHTLRDREAKIPHLLCDVAIQIENHRHFASLCPITKMRYAECVVLHQTKKRGEQVSNNKFMRQLWRKLYHGE